MNDEIKEILDKLKDNYWRNFPEDGIPYKVLYMEEVDLLLDYITNLQQENEKLKAQLTDTEWEYQNTRCKYEKQYKKGITEELIEDIETCFFNRENPSMIPIDSLDICHIFGYIDYLKDYKSRCEKASDNLKRNYWINEHEHNDDVVNMTLNILQNGSEENE